MPTSHLTHDELFAAQPLEPHPSPGTVQMNMEEFPQLKALLHANKEWSDAVKGKEPDFFTECAKGQWPKILWIGCADSRVPESIIMGQKPGEVFVHRNIANQFQPNDDSANALVDYAILSVGVEHVGHTGCGGCIAAHSSPMPPTPVMNGNDLAGAPASGAPTALGRFLDPIIRLKHSLDQNNGKECQVNDLIWENVKMSVQNIAKSEVMKKAWMKAIKGEGQEVHVHGWIYDLSTGLLQDIGCSVGPEQMMPEKK